MDTSNSAPKGQTLHSLNVTGHPEDLELAKKYWEVLKALMNTLRPLVRYVVSPLLFQNERGGTVSKRAVGIGLIDGELSVYLDDKGNIFTARDKEICPTSENDSIVMLGCLPILDIFSSLQTILHEAKEKHEKHVASIAEQTAKLDEIMAILNR